MLKDMSKYMEIADSLRDRIRRGEFPKGSKLPGISALQDEYGVRGLETIRSAQQVLVGEKMLKTVQGVGAIVTATEPVVEAKVDVVGTLNQARDSLTIAIRALEERRETVTFDLTDDEDTYFVLTEALADYARLQRAAANDGGYTETRMRWAEAAEAALSQITAARVAR